MKKLYPVYAAFDLYPSAKGASTHINKFAFELFRYFNDGSLYVLGNSTMPEYQIESTVTIIRFRQQIANFLSRALTFSSWLQQHLESKPPDIFHFRDIWGGLALLNSGIQCKSIFEVNSLISLEIKNRYPEIEQKTLDKFKEIEIGCLQKADEIVTPSNVIKQYLKTKLNHSNNNITVISNGADQPGLLQKHNGMPERYILYFGALQNWQGIDVLLKAFQGLSDINDLKLVICSSNPKRYAKQLRKFAEKLAIADRITWNYQLGKDELNAWVSNAICTVAPLKSCQRNLTQGCSPLKIIESLACKTPVVASDIPAVKEIISHNETGILVRPDRPAHLSRALRHLIDDEQKRDFLSKQGFLHFKENFTWDKKLKNLNGIYERIS